MGEVDNLRFGAGLALSHTFPGLANLYVGTSFVQEMGEYFGHAYVGGKLKVTNYALLSARTASGSAASRRSMHTRARSSPRRMRTG